MKYGFVKPTLYADNYVLGAINSLPKTVLQPDGQWDKYLPLYEAQAEKYETYGCTVWGTENAIEILEKRLYGIDTNHSERFIYILGGVKPPGADPHTICEVIRKNGLIPNESLPYPATYEEFIAPNPMKEGYLKQGREYLDKRSVGHEWVFTNVDKKTQISRMKEALMYSPLGISVSAWYSEDGIYIDQGQANNHWTVCYGYTEANGKIFWKVFDSYDHSLKILHPDHNIQFCKRFSITTRTPQTNGWLIEALKSLLAFIRPVKSPVEVPYVKSPRERLYETAVACLDTDASPKDLAPDDLACAESVNNVYFKAFGEYIETPGLSTTKLFAAMMDRTDKFLRVTDCQEGNIIISPTGFSKNSSLPIPNGHVGIIGKSGKIMSNSSATGKFIENYTLNTWTQRYRATGGYPIHVFKVM